MVCECDFCPTPDETVETISGSSCGSVKSYASRRDSTAVDVLDGMKVGNMTTNQNDAYIFAGPITWNNDRFFVFSNSDNEMQHKRMTDDESESVLCNRHGTHVEEDKNYSDPVLSPNELPRDEQKTCVKRDNINKAPYPLARETNPVPHLPFTNSTEQNTDVETRPQTRTDTANNHSDSGHSDVFQYLETGPIDIKRITKLSVEELHKYVENVENERAVHKKKAELIQQLIEKMKGLSSDKDMMISYVKELVNTDKRLKTQQSYIENIAADQEDMQNQDAYPSNGIYSAKQLEIQNTNSNIPQDVSECVGVNSVLTGTNGEREKTRELSSKDSAIYSCSQSQMYPIT
ncbi:uncharacterized protein LOC127872829 [Dreissena polymorpha]|uniref:uncharacterized protein LOC127872829 n=1 Tax=Dreissena polymorpha TaxID=45954 RepID=UPI0022650014|nr:uncharacterized protein LOC127872829 [Dreissena polymorpha]